MDILASLPCASSSVGPANQLLGLLLQTIFADQCALSPPQLWPTDYAPTALANGLPEFDYIVVGSGTAGSIVASRLSEDPSVNVLLLEAGPDPPMESEIPYFLVNLFTSPYDWEVYTQPSNVASLAMANGAFWPRGKMLGGCHSHNAMLYVRGVDRDYNIWADFTKNPLWSWDSVLPYFLKSENNGDPTIAADTRYHGTGGLLHINHYNFTEPIKYALRDCYQESGIRQIPDINADRHLGAVFLQGTIYEGTRFSTAKAYLTPANQRPNFHIIKNALVSTLNFSPNKLVTGVNFNVGGQSLTAHARREYILSAGSVGSPQILLNSGIGPAAHLNSLNINVVRDLPVGLNLLDHLIVPYVFSVFQSTATNPNLIETAENYYDYITNRSGLYATVGLTELNAFVSTINSKYPDIQYDSTSFPKNTPGIVPILQAYGYGPDIINSIVAANQQADTMVILLTLLQPESVGKLELSSTDPTDQPKVFAGYLTEQRDVNTLLAGIRILQRIEKTRAFKKMEGQYVKIGLSNCDNNYKYDSNAYWECYIRNMSSSGYHPIGTNRMGELRDPTSVTDSNLRVKGVPNLRVIDASIMPKQISGNINAATIMVAEVGSDLIKGVIA